MTESTPFQLSRIYASGWSAGRKCTADGSSEIDAQASDLNPHQSHDERERWSQGFKDAAFRQLGPPVKLRHSPSRSGG
jgi:hypothetical protein